MIINKNKKIYYNNKIKNKMIYNKNYRIKIYNQLVKYKKFKILL